MQTIRLLNAAMLTVVPQPELRELLQQQGQAIEGMTRLLNALLDISRLESGAIEPTISDVSLAEVFGELRTEFQSVARAREIDFRVDSPMATLATDRTLFGQLLQNLLGNALKYTDRGFVSLRGYREGDDFVVAVEDSGIGIPSDKLDRIFDEYYQVDTHGAKRVGVGLGLAIVKEVARLLGFSVRISSTVGSGTSVQVRIPERCLLADAAAAASSTVPSPRTTSLKSRVFLVEDNDGVRAATEIFLKFEGYEMQSAPSVAEAESLFEGLRAGDIIVADYHLDSRNTGLDMLLRLRERVGRDVPAIILSGDLPSVLRSIKSPIVNCRFLSKPVDTAELVQAIGELSSVSEHQEHDAA